MVSFLDKIAKDQNEMDEFSKKLAVIILKNGID
jgi:hypothetical protein